MKRTYKYGAALRCYDNGGKSFDRYVIVPPRWAKEYQTGAGLIAASEFPTSPQGFGQHVSVASGRHLGKRIPWSSLPPDVQVFARSSFPEYAPDGKQASLF